MPGSEEEKLFVENEQSQYVCVPIKNPRIVIPKGNTKV